MTATDYETPATAGGWLPARLLLIGGTLAVTLALSACGGSAKPSKKAAQTGGGSSSSASTSASAPTSAAGGASSSGGGNTTKPGGGFCSLLTADEAQTVVGTPLSPGLPRSGNGPAGPAGSCLYKAAKPVAGLPTVVQVIVLGTKFPRAVYDQELRHDPDAPDIKALPGLGEDAFFIPGVVTVFDHGLVMSVQAVTGGHPVDTAVITDLLRKALSRAGGLR